MKAYYLVFVLTLLVSLLYNAKTDRQWRWKLFWTLLPLFIFGAIRVDFGNDYLPYEMSYHEFHKMFSFEYDSESHFEIGYQILCYILPSFRLLLVLNAFLLCMALGVFSYKNIPQKYLWIVILLIFLNAEKNIYGNLVGIRNGFAVSGFLLGSVLIQNRKWLLFLLLTLLLSTIHLSVLLFLPLAYVVGRNVPFTNKELIGWIVAVIILLGFSMSGLLNLITPIVENYFVKYEYYLDVIEGHRGLLLTFSSILLFVLILYLAWSYREGWNREQNSLLRMGLLYVCMAFAGSLAVRSIYYYNMFFIGTVVLLYSKRGSKHNIEGLMLLFLTLAMSLYSLRLWQTAQWVQNNPLYWNYHSLIGNWNW